MQTQLFRQMRARYENFQRNRVAFDPGARAWYSITNKDEGPTDVYIYDAIGFFGVEAESFVKEFDAIENDRITLRINSPGGDVFDGMSIYNSIKRHPATVTTEIDGVAASMASIIALAGDVVNMSELGLFMVHEPFSMVMGNASDMRAEADLLDKVSDQGVAIYTNASKLTEADVRAAMSAETWYTSKEALSAGFVQSISDGIIAPSELFDLNVFQNAPEAHCVSEVDRDGSPTRRSIEHALIDVGLSQKKAKALLSEGYKKGTDSRDAVGELEGARHLINLYRGNKQ